MTAKEKAIEIVDKMESDFQYFASREIAIKHALISVDMIINSNPYSNPFNTTTYSTMDYWQEVKEEIEKL